MAGTAGPRESLLPGSSSAGGRRVPGGCREFFVVLCLACVVYIFHKAETDVLGFQSEAPSPEWLRDAGAPPEFVDCVAKNMQCCLNGNDFTFGWSNLTQRHIDEPLATPFAMIIQTVVMNMNYMLVVFTVDGIWCILALIYIVCFHFLLRERPKSVPEAVSTQRATVRVVGRVARIPAHHAEVESPQVVAASTQSQSAAEADQGEFGDQDLHLLWDLVRRLAMGIIILNIYYNDGLVTTKVHKFSMSCLLIFCERIVLVWLSRRFHQNCVPETGQSRRVPVKTVYDDVYNMTRIEADGTYYEGKLNPCKNLARVLMIFVCQFGMCMYYYCVMEGMANGITTTKYDDNVGLKIRNCGEVSMVKWFIATIIIHVSGEDEVGTGFQWDFWNFQFYGRPQRMERTWQSMTKRNKYILMTRFGFSFIVNSVFRSMILGTAPMMLCVEEPLDFVKDVLAICFIIKLDDFVAEKEYDVDTEMDRPAIASDAFFSALWGAIRRIADMVYDSVCCRSYR